MIKYPCVRGWSHGNSSEEFFFVTEDWWTVSRDRWNSGLDMKKIMKLFHVCDIVILHIYIFFASHTPMIMHNWVYSTSSSISSISCNTIIDLHHEEGDDVYSWHDFSDFWFNERNILSPRHKKYFSSIYIKIIIYEKRRSCWCSTISSERWQNNGIFFPVLFW